MTNGTDSPIVQAVRKAREEIAKECGYDLRKLLDLLKRDEKASGRPTGSPRRARTG
jgi:hypothetical protein